MTTFSAGKHPPASSPAIRRRMLAQQTVSTIPERKLRQALRAVGLTGYRVQWPLPPTPRRTADIAWPGRRIAVFVDGCFWHGCPDCGKASKTNTEWWGRKIASNKARDADTTAELERAGWLVIRVWEHENAAEAAARIKEWM